jgi:NADH-quinone oxidoreductase subunit L
MKKWVEPSAVVVSATGIESSSSGPGELRIVPTAVKPRAEEGGHESSPCGSETPVGGICQAPSISHAPFKWSKAAMSVLIVLAGIILSWLLCVQLYERKNKTLVGLTTRNKLLGAGYTFLANKYYLDALYENVIVRGIAHPIARGAYWINQNILDGIVNGAGKVTRVVAGWVYRNVDQRVVDGAVNGSGSAARGLGSVVRPVQSGKVNQYGALLFGAAAIGALVLIIN